MMINRSSPSPPVLFSVPTGTATVVVFDFSVGVVGGSVGTAVGGGRISAFNIK